MVKDFGEMMSVKNSVMNSLMDVGRESWCEGQNIWNQIVTILCSITGTGVIKNGRCLCTVQQVSLCTYIYICSCGYVTVSSFFP